MNRQTNVVDGSGNVRSTHSTVTKAIDEAERLAWRERGTRFEVRATSGELRYGIKYEVSAYGHDCEGG